MSNLIREFRSELNNFWKWSGITAKEYNQYHLEEDNYPRWMTLKGLAYEAIKQLGSGYKSKELTELILEFMALDNEAEYTLDVCENELSKKELIYLIESSIKFPLSDARWQIAELVGRKNDINLIEYLLVLIDDENKYVQRRALLSLRRVVPEKAEEIAKIKINDEDDYLRLVSLRILRELSSEYLKEAVDLLKIDPNEYIKLEADETRTELK